MTRTNGNQPETIADLLLRSVTYEYDARNNPEAFGSGFSGSVTLFYEFVHKAPAAD